MIECRFRPVAEWPGTPKPSWKQKTGSFKAGWSQTLDLLEKELNYLRAKEIVIEGYFEFGQIRNDGWPKSSARPSKPGSEFRPPRRDSLCPAGAALVSTMPAPPGFIERGYWRKDFRFHLFLDIDYL